MKIHPLLVLVVLQLLLSSGWKGYGQVDNLRFEHLSIEDGLSHNSVFRIIEDKKGYLWFGTRDGLNRYDGYLFKVYKFDPADSASLPQNEIITLWEDSSGIIWIGTTGGGLSKFDPATEKFTEYKPKENSDNYRSVSVINEDSEGMMWIGTYGGDLHRFNKSTNEFSEGYDLGYDKLPDSMKFSMYSHDVILGMYKDASGVLWIGSATGLHKLNLIPGEKGKTSQISFTHYRHDPKNPNTLNSFLVGRIYGDHEGMLWIISRGLNRFDPKTGTVTRYLHDPKNPYSISHNNINSIVEDKQGNLWIATYGGGLNKLNKERTRFVSYVQEVSDPASLSSNILSSIFIDKAGTLWMGTSGKGICKTSLQTEKFTTYTHNPFNKNSVSDGPVTAIWEDKNGIMWIGTGNQGLNRFDRKNSTFTHYLSDSSNAKSLWSDYIAAILEAKDGNLWICHSTIIGMGSGISKLKYDTHEFDRSSGNTDVDKILSKTFIYTIYADGQGIIWLGTVDGLIQFNVKTNQYVHYKYDPKNRQGISDYEVRAIGEDARGDLWIGHGSIAVTKLNKKTGRFTQYKHNNHDSTSISSVVIKSIYKDSKGNIWFGTVAGGLCRYNYEQDNFSTFTERHGLANNTIYSIVEDNRGSLWLGTNKGLSEFSLSTHIFTNYDLNDGLQSNQFGGGSANTGSCFKGTDGTLYFGGSNGFNAFDPDKLQLNRYMPPVVITGFRLFDKLIPGKDASPEIVLRSNENFFSFEFAALNFSNSQKNQYAYTLDGLDQQWVYSGTRRFASYTNVSPGEYVFRVKGSNNDGIWNEKGSSIRIIILPPWWRTWWAYTFYGICFISAIFFFDRHQRRRLIQKERERTRERELAQAHEIEKAYEELKVTQAQLIHQEKMASLGEVTAGIAHEIQNPLNFVNNFSEVSTELIEDLEKEVIKGDKDETMAIAADIKENLVKITHHGKRASAIVKGMLQHSQQTPGNKEPFDINALVNEYVRISYHGMRAKDKSFNATLQTHFDPMIGKIEIVPQSLGRVLLNLLNNAFYAVDEKQKKPNGLYEPVVIINTKKANGTVIISVKDNGDGIPSKVLNKIFQPFFSTKPTGQGTGLGLSLSYDIITKEYGGKLKVQSEEGEYAEFIITLPIITQPSDNK